MKRLKLTLAVILAVLWVFFFAPARCLGAEFEFSFDYLGWEEIGGDFPYQHSWDVNITQWDPSVLGVNEVDVEGPHVMPSYVEVSPPNDWSAGPQYIGRYSYQTDPNNEFTGTGTYTGWKVNAKTPLVETGRVYLTRNGERVSPIVEAMVVAPEPNSCGRWGYLSGDNDHDCDVDFVDFSYFAQKWMGCTDPAGQDCIYETIVGVGFAFDGEDITGPATVAFLCDDTPPGYLEPNDIIVEYQLVPISCGANLRDVIEGMVDIGVGELVPMKILRDGVPMDVTAPAWEIPLASEQSDCAGKRCVEGKVTPSDKKVCHCIEGGTDSCVEDKEYAHIPWEHRSVFRYRCADTSGTTCQGDWFDIN